MNRPRSTTIHHHYSLRQRAAVGRVDLFGCRVDEERIFPGRGRFQGSSQGFLPSANENLITALFWFLVQSYNGAATSNCLLYTNDYEITRHLEVLRTTRHLELDTSAVAKPWKKKLKKSLYFLHFSSYFYWDLIEASTHRRALWCPRAYTPNFYVYVFVIVFDFN
ncbi:hypothetical protein TNCV_4270311 [Trichonephila clavipes]|nr:hypothetical protein TNCV_4270311 [Trichonephila clavipes]